jgi:23S rRNA (uracil1939-C5)-methyltransferase
MYDLERFFYLGNFEYRDIEAMQEKMIRGPVMLDEIHSSGRSIANLEGKKIYIDLGIPGEEVTYLGERNRQGFRAGRVIECSKPSPHRTEPFCIHFGQCGGCTWQHIDYSYQLKLKHRILTNALVKYEIPVPVVPPVIPSPDIRYFRHRMEYTFASHAENNIRTGDFGSPTPALGFHKLGEPAQIIDIRECYLQQQPSRSICDFLKSYALEQDLEFYNHQNKTGFLRSLSIRIGRSGDAMVVIGFSEDKPVERENLFRRLMHEFPDIVSLNWTIHLSHAHSQLQGEIIPYGNTEPYLYKMIGGNRFRVHATSFFQPNARQAENIFLMIQEWANLTGSGIVYDLYSGVGCIAIFLADGAEHVTGIEGSPKAVEDAKVNADTNDIDNVDFFVGDILETFKPQFIAEHGKPNLIVLDPPRSGTLIEIKKNIIASGAERVIYLSCNPVSLAFDLKQLKEVYKVARIQPFDMLPHSHHLETLVMLERL